MLIRLLYPAPYAPAKERRRLWLAVGNTISLGRGSFCQAEHRICKDRYINRYLPILLLFNNRLGQRVLILGEKELFNLRRFAPLNLVPRALELAEDGIPQRYFLEFFYHDVAARPGGPIEAA